VPSVFLYRMYTLEPFPEIINNGVEEEKEGEDLHVKVAELVGESPSSWKDAVRSAVREASKTLKNISGVEVMNLTANVKDGELVEYKANVKIAYTGEDA